MFGKINNPLQNWGWGSLTGVGGLGPIDLLSNVFQLMGVVAGLYALVNMVLAGIKFIYSAGDPSKVEEAQKQMYMSLIGLIIIVLSYSVASILGSMLFDRPGFIFYPRIYGPGVL